MKYFRVEEDWISNIPRRMEVASDGEQVAEGYDTSEIVNIILGYSVFIEGEDGRTEDVEFYPVSTNTRTLEDNHKEVLEQIKQDFPAPEWQNNAW